MCITFLYISDDPDKDNYKLILVMNRDEFFKRPTSSLSWADEILAGRDQEPGKEGGTWLGMNKKGQIGLLTNIYTGKPSPGAGRGFLVIDALKGSDAKSYLDNLSQCDTKYSPFNLMLLEPKDGKYQGHYYCRGLEGCFVSESSGPIELERGFHGLSNHPKDTPYQKTQHGIGLLKKVFLDHAGSQEELISMLFDMMNDGTSHFPDEQMIKQGGNQSPMAPFHPNLACINVDISERGYGTRVTTLILIDKDNNATVIEKSREKANDQVSFNFKIE